MSVRTKYYFGPVGTKVIVDPDISNVAQILCVTRSGMVYSRTILSAGNLEYKYEAAAGRIRFQNDFIGPPPDQPTSINSLERVSIKFKE